MNGIQILSQGKVQIHDLDLLSVTKFPSLTNSPSEFVFSLQLVAAGV